MSNRPCSVVRHGTSRPPAQGKVKIVNVGMNQIEVRRFPEHFFHHDHVMRHRIFALSVSLNALGHMGTSRALVTESPLANNVTSCPRRTNSSVSQYTTRSVPPYSTGGTLRKAVLPAQFSFSHALNWSGLHPAISSHY